MGLEVLIPLLVVPNKIIITAIWTTHKASMGNKNKSKTLWTLFKQVKDKPISQLLAPGWVRALKNKTKIGLRLLEGNLSRVTTIHLVVWSIAIRWVHRRLFPIILMAAPTMKRLQRKALKQTGNYLKRAISSTKNWGSNLISPMQLTINWGQHMQISRIRPMGHNNNLRMQWVLWALLVL